VLIQSGNIGYELTDADNSKAVCAGKKGRKRQVATTNEDGRLNGDSEKERRSAVILARGVSAELGPQIIDDASQMPDARPEIELHDNARTLNDEKGKKRKINFMLGDVADTGSTVRNEYFGLVALVIGCVVLL
jgi:hypothetical protein